ncbi:MAG: hypothetical protein WC490_00665 [Candidatus Margulisiibacteriota bacterium]
MAEVSRAQLDRQMAAARAQGQRNNTITRRWETACQVVRFIAMIPLLPLTLTGCAGAGPASGTAPAPQSRLAIDQSGNVHVFVGNKERTLYKEPGQVPTEPKTIVLLSESTQAEVLTLYVNSNGLLKMHRTYTQSCGSGTDHKMKVSEYRTGNAIPPDAKILKDVKQVTGWHYKVAVDAQGIIYSYIVNDITGQSPIAQGGGTIIY